MRIGGNDMPIQAITSGRQGAREGRDQRFPIDDRSLEATDLHRGMVRHAWHTGHHQINARHRLHEGFAECEFSLCDVRCGRSGGRIGRNELRMRPGRQGDHEEGGNGRNAKWAQWNILSVDMLNTHRAGPSLTSGKRIIF